jgi:hypothetical protein
MDRASQERTRSLSPQRDGDSHALQLQREFFRERFEKVRRSL